MFQAFFSLSFAVAICRHFWGSRQSRGVGGGHESRVFGVIYACVFSQSARPNNLNKAFAEMVIKGYYCQQHEFNIPRKRRREGKSSSRPKQVSKTALEDLLE